ncbi:MAG: hypothetical protein ABSF21_00620 [Dehalococcoidia bacterium]
MSEKSNIPTKIPIDLDGRRRYFHLGLLAIALWELNTGKPLFSKKGWDHFSKKDMFLMIWACLREDDPKLKPQDVVQMFKDNKIPSGAVLQDFIQQLSAAWGAILDSFAGGEK